MIRFDGEVAIITGAANGQGAAEAQMFVELGARVVLADVDADGVHALAAALGPERALAVELDVSSETQWLAAVVATERKFGCIDVLVNNAGIFRSLPLIDADLNEVRRVFEINQMGTYLGVRIVGSRMRAAGRGSIVNVASIAALAPGEASAIYGMTKAAVVNLTKGAALELGPAIRVNCVLPGGINTRMLSAGSEPFFRSIPLQRIGQPDEISRAVVFFASQAGSYCTGATLVVDGGWTLGQSKENFRRLAERAAEPGT
jgi:3alpha(or 20beta)-hydroxysteroid dehydrogenase